MGLVEGDSYTNVILGVMNGFYAAGGESGLCLQHGEC